MGSTYAGAMSKLRVARSTALAAAPLAFAAAVALAACSSAPSESLADYATPEDYARALFEDVNTARMAEGELGSFTWSDCLATMALPRAEKTLTEVSLSHEPLQATCTPNVAIGENLSRGAFTPQEITAKWMASPGHRANILRPGFTNAGVSCVAMSAADLTVEAKQGEDVGGYACSLIFEGGE